MEAEIIAIGDEILIGQVTDTNSGWIARELGNIGFALKRISAISDNRDEIISNLREARERSQLVLVTGGLGPTRDDLTKDCLAELYQCKLYFDEKAYENVAQIFEKAKRPMIESNRQQAMLPEKCRPLYNPEGTAPGMLFEEKGRLLISMPGVPSEMKAIMNTHVLPLLKEKSKGLHIIHRTILTANIGESFLAEKIKDLEDSLPEHIKLAYLPFMNTVRLRFTGKSKDKQSLKAELDYLVSELRRLAGEHIIAEEDMKLQGLIGDICRQRKVSIGTVESCTGGYISHLITSIPGSSAYYMGSLVTYSNELKQQLVNVKAETIEKFGAVSEQTVREMAENGRSVLGVDYCIAVSGIAGPGGGTAEKPVGSVFMAVAGPKELLVQFREFRGVREQVIERTAMFSLEMLRKLILSK